MSLIDFKLKISMCCKFSHVGTYSFTSMVLIGFHVIFLILQCYFYSKYKYQFQ
jgi:hypothetical protein